MRHKNIIISYIYLKHFIVILNAQLISLALCVSEPLNKVCYIYTSSKFISKHLYLPFQLSPNPLQKQKPLS